MRIKQGERGFSVSGAYRFKTCAGEVGFDEFTYFFLIIDDENSPR
jgi:hypothetical protein